VALGDGRTLSARHTTTPKSLRCAPTSCGLGLALLLVTSGAHAYRPFDGTDGDVAEPGNFELELGPAQFYREGSNNYLFVPATVLNLGLVPRLEFVVDFRHVVALDHRNADVENDRLLDTDVLLKYLLRRGTLQGGSGLSIAAEGGLLTPEFGGRAGFGAQVDFIFSYKWNGGALHFNEQIADSREHEADLFSGLIVEGPESLSVRPVGEIFVEHNPDDGTQMSGLVGAIWPASDALTLDGGVRVARVGGLAAEEIRFGLTWVMPLWSQP
jgi:hypothetical protein